MKKTFAAALSTTLVLGFAGTALAIHGEIPAETSTVVAAKGVTIGLDGDIRFRGFQEQDIVKDNANVTGYDGRVRLGVTGKVGDVTGYVQLETGDESKDTYTWGNGTSDGLTTGGSKQIDGATDLSILQAWINWNPGKLGVKVGHMPLALGNKIFFDHTGSGDDAIIGYMNPNENTHLALLAVKFEEGTDPALGTKTNADDINGYIALLQQKLANGGSFGVNITNLNSGGQAVAPDLNFYNIGADLTIKAGNVTITGDVEYQTGDVDDVVDQDALAAMVSARFNMGNGYIGFLAGYGSGEDNADNTNDEFVTFRTDTRYETTIIGYRLAVPGQAKNSGLTNLTLLQLNGGVKGVCPITKKDLSVMVAVTQANLTEDVGFADDDLGLEIDANLKWKLTSGLSYKLELAYLLTGDAYGANTDDYYFIRNGLELAF